MKTVYILLVSAYLRISRRKVQKTQNLRGIIQDLNFFFGGGGASKTSSIAYSKKTSPTWIEIFITK